MPLPDVVEIMPLERAVAAEVVVPGSKSITNRALILAALGEGETMLEGALWSEDTQVMVECLQELGYMVNVAPDREEPCNRTITVFGLSGEVPRGGTVERPLELFVANAGTAARFLTALVCLGQGVYRIAGVPRMHERPQAALFQALRGLGYGVDSSNNKLPALVQGAGPKAGKVKVDIGDSSQFASALLLCARAGGWTVEVTGENAEESPYVNMTSQLLANFGKGAVAVEPDASSGSYFWGINALLPGPDGSGMGIRVARWPRSGWQIDEAFPRFLPLPNRISRRDELGDSIMTAIVLAPFSKHPVCFTELGRLRVQECERVVALRAELTRCGAEVREEGDMLLVSPSASHMHGAEIETYNDHRMAMCFSILGLKVPGIKIKNPGCVRKTFPNFFQKLAAPPPAGLGATIVDIASGRRMWREELLAE